MLASSRSTLVFFFVLLVFVLSIPSLIIFQIHSDSVQHYNELKAGLQKTAQTQETTVKLLESSIEKQKSLTKSNEMDLASIRRQLENVLRRFPSNSELQKRLEGASLVHGPLPASLSSSSSAAEAAAISSSSESIVRIASPKVPTQLTTGKKHWMKALDFDTISPADKMELGKKLFLNTGNEATPEQQQYCSIPRLQLEPDWIEMLLQPVSPKESCVEVPQFVKVQNQHLVQTGCEDGSIMLTWLDLHTADWKNESFSESMPLPSESGIAICQQHDKKHFNLWTELITDEDADGDTKSHDDRPNIVIYFVDSLAPRRMQRELPKTWQLFSEMEERSHPTHSALRMKRFNVVKGGTQNNAPALLAGYNFADLPDDMSGTTWLFDTAKENGYKTMLVEMDSVEGKSSMARIRRKTHQIGTTTDENILKQARADESKLADHVLAVIWDKVLKWMDDPSMSSFGSASHKLCFGGRYLHTYALDYIEEAMNAYSNHPKFLVYMPMEVHEPTMQRGASIDEDLSNSISRMLSKHPNTIVMFMGDHGLGYGPWQESRVGRLEEKMPVLWWAIPDTQQQLLSKMQPNEYKLVTAYDLHATMRILLHGEQHMVGDGSKFGGGFGRSLLSPISGNRTCSDVHVSVEWCSCIEIQEYSKSDLDSTLIQSLATQAITQYNDKILEHSPTSCYDLKLLQILDGAFTKSDIHSTKRSGDTLITLRFSVATPSAYDNIFSANFLSVSTTKMSKLKEKVQEDYPLQEFLVGEKFDSSAEVFAQQGIISMPKRGPDLEEILTARMTCVETWDPPLSSDVTVLLRWVNPRGQFYEQSLHTLEDKWTSSWQSRDIPLQDDEGSLEGVWRAELWQGSEPQPSGVKLGDKLVESSFYLSYKNIDPIKGKYTPLSPDVMSRFWQISEYRRETPYAKDQECADSQVPIDICICA